MKYIKFGFIIVVLACLVISCEQETPQAGVTSRDVLRGDREGNSEGDQEKVIDIIEDIYGDSVGEAAIDSVPDSDPKNFAGDTVFEETVDDKIDAGPSSQETTDSGVCEQLDLSLEGVPVRLMLLQDRSGSMNDVVEGISKWNMAANAVTDLISIWGNDIDIGIDFFPDPHGRNPCSVTPVVASDSRTENTATIIDSTEPDRPMPEGSPAPPDGSGPAPLYLAIENFLNSAHAPLFLEGDIESYLVVVSDRADTCMNSNQRPSLIPFLGPDPSEGHTPGEFASLVAQVLEKTGVKTVAIGFGNEAGLDQLSAIAENGGTEFTTVFQAVDGEALQYALSTIAESIHVGCTFSIGEQDEEDLNLDLANVYLDDTPVPRDDGCVAGHGWSWRDASRTVIEFCEESCAAVKGGFFESLSIKIMCTEDELSIVQGNAVDSSTL